MKRQIMIGTLLVLLAALIGYNQFFSVEKPMLDEQQTETPKILYWYDPMMPNQHFEKPGPSPFMDMDLVPKYADEVAALNSEYRLIQKTGVRIGRVEKIQETLFVPSEAVLATGKYNVVIIPEAEGYFHSVEVAIGKEENEKTEILSGLKEGEQIVLSAQFLIDSEANVDMAMQRLQKTGEMP